MNARRPTRTARAVVRRSAPLLAADVTEVDFKDVALLRTFRPYASR